MLANTIMEEHRKELVREATIINELGLHARSAARIAKIAQRAAGRIWIMNGAVKADAASVIDILTLEGFKGSSLTFEIENRRDAELLSELVQLVKSGFGE